MAERWDFQNNRPSKIYDLEPSRPPTRMLLWLAFGLSGWLAGLSRLSRGKLVIMAMIRMNDAELHKRLKVAAATVGCSVEAYVAEAVRLRLNGKQPKLPPQELMKAQPKVTFRGAIPKTVSARKSKGK